jgi:glucose dehydrogenase
LKLLAGTALGFGILIGVTQVGFAEDALTNADSNGGLMYGRTYHKTRFSPLTQINTQNVGQITPRMANSPVGNAVSKLPSY